MKFRKLIMTLFMSALIMVTFSNTIFAHSAGGEMFGWPLDTGYHTGTKSVYYNFDSISMPLGDPYRTYTIDGAKKWNDTNAISIAVSSAYTGKVYKFYDPNNPNIAEFYDYSSDGIGHLTSWKIRYNTAKMDSRTSSQNTVTAAHELGHAIGLNDLKLDGNSDKLMYGYSDRTATGPTTNDQTGAKEAWNGTH
jgi:hypothetical protein